MFTQSSQAILIFAVCVVTLLLLFAGFIITIIYRYQKKQHTYYKELETIKATHQNQLLQSQLEMQEQTFQNISREIHDNIGQKLTLAKLQLNTLNLTDKMVTTTQISGCVNMISEAISDLSDISRSLSSEIVLCNGLIKALEFETVQLQKSGLYQITLSVTGNPVFMKSTTELMLFRIVQEGINNIIKHATATSIDILLEYDAIYLTLQIKDNGKGFIIEEKNIPSTGLQNMQKRAAQLYGVLKIESQPGKGTKLLLEIPLNKNKDDKTY